MGRLTMSALSPVLTACLRRAEIYSHTRKTTRRLVRLLANEHVVCPRLSQKYKFSCTQSMGLMTSSSPGVRLSVDKPECLVDENVVVKVTGLPPNDRVTVIATAVHDENLFWSHGLFRANDGGVVDLSTDTPINGSYDEADPCGLIWSMVAAPWLPSHLRMFQTRAIKPRIITFSVFPESDSPWDYLKNKTNVLASVEHKRWYKSQNTRRIPIDHPRIQGTLFLPEGPGPFPGVVDMYGGLVTIVEGRAALLASRGFATMSLSYVHGKGLPQTLVDIELSYLEEAAEWFAKLPEVRSDGVGILSLCLGGTVALWMAQTIPNIRAVVNINGMPYANRFWTYHGREYESNTRIDETQIIVTEEGLSVRNMFDVADDSFLKPWTHGARLLTISGGDDLMTQMEHNVHFYEKIMPQDYRREKAEFVVYPGAGHLIEPPHTPLCRVVDAADKIQLAVNIKNPKHQHNNMLLSGGYPKEHAAAQMEAWQRAISFLKTHLM
ncbi:bile acid-CoA:amino acid N-acyltransferase-like [Mizuhopecten yessoensis]|uniref:Bile acid-CoA:amino acid N-acyltransferase n=1 Tax=Mizuhopecten yessoensis TaxID=6573 RepID=A0A210R1S3_MIZYE|nr:bile acid-CoA:amino acid N-acyltransferase-like [Mizuhopecten yessoensis]OWF54896.1 Bile acid-CoA:amino acid N-acyltransferase [Mizuhopecten yessoensis]